MKDVYFLVENSSKEQRQTHLDLEESCLERGGCSTNHKGVLAQYLNTNIPKGLAPAKHPAVQPVGQDP